MTSDEIFSDVDCDISGYVSFVNESGDGGYYVPIDIASHLKDELSKIGFIAVKNKREGVE